MTHDADATPARSGELDRDALLRLLIASVEEYAIYLLDVHGRVASWNIGAERIKGYAASEIIGQSVARFYPEEEIQRGKVERDLETAARVGRFEEESWRVRKDGSRFWASIVLTALYDETGKLRGYGKVTRDLTARRRREAVELANRQLNEILDTVDDAITVVDDAGDLLYSNGAANRMWRWQPNGHSVPLNRESFRERYRVYDAGGRQLPPSEWSFARTLRGDELRGELMRIDDVESGRSIWGLVTTRAVERDGRRYAIVVVHDVTQRRRVELGERFLSETGAVLAAGLDSDQTLRKVAFLAVPDIADWCSVDLLEPDGTLRQVAIAHADPAKVELARELRRRFPPDPQAPAGPYTVVRTGRSELYAEIPEQLLVESARGDADLLRILRELELRTAITVPLVARGRILGVLTLVGSQPGARYDERDLAVAEELGRRAGIAVDNAMLYESERLARQDAERAARELAALQTVSDTALANLGLEALMRELLERLRGILHTDTSTILLYDPERGDLVVRASSGLESEVESETRVPMGRGLSGSIAAERRPKVFDDIAAVPPVSDLLREKVRSAVGVPLVLEDRLIGVLHTASIEPRHFAEREVRFLELVAQRVALAIENARLLADTQAAVRVRDEFLSIAGHELRTPLSALYLQLQSLERAIARAGESPRLGERVKKAGEQAMRLGRLIEDLLDVSRVTGGRLQLHREPLDFAAVVRDATERFSEEARNAGCELIVRAEAAPGRWDRGRLEQVVINLLGNAVKYGKGRPVIVEVGHRPGWVTLIVRDEGIGIAPEHQARIFERFERAVSERHYGGLGLGLWITRQIVEAHGGRIRVDSNPGVGSTFTVELPA